MEFVYSRNIDGKKNPKNMEFDAFTTYLRGAKRIKRRPNK